MKVQSKPYQNFGSIKISNVKSGTLAEIYIVKTISKDSLVLENGEDYIGQPVKYIRTKYGSAQEFGVIDAIKKLFIDPESVKIEQCYDFEAKKGIKEYIKNRN